MNNFEAVPNITNFCKVLVKKDVADEPEGNKGKTTPSNEANYTEICSYRLSEAIPALSYGIPPEIEEPLVDVFDENDYVRILVQCHCQEQQVTFHPTPDGITVCREECHKEKDGSERCSDVCRKLKLKTDELQLDDMLFIVAKCNNNNTLEAMIPKLKK